MKTHQQFAADIISEVEKIIIGKKDQVEIMITAILSGGHILLNDLPGSGKTTLVKTLSIALGCDFRRIQFTPDLLPSDVIGMNIFNQKEGSFSFMQGPIHTNILLADEINRAIPRTQSALLEGMEECQVTVDGVSRPLPNPFLVMATQNPVESESTFHLPVAQMDRFFVRLSLGYPTVEEEVEMLTKLGDGLPFEHIMQISSPEEIVELQHGLKEIHVSEASKNYIISLVHQTRNHPLLKSGASPRASRSLHQGSKAYAAIRGRKFVTPDDVQKIAVPVLAHRIQLMSEARFKGKTEEDLVKEILRNTPVPPRKEELFDE